MGLIDIIKPLSTVLCYVINQSTEKFLGTTGIEPWAAGWEASMIPPCYAAPTLFVRNLLSANLLAFSVIWLTREYRRVCLFQSWSWSPSSRLSWPVSSPSTASSSLSSSPESSTQRPNTHFTSEISVLASSLVSSMGLYRKLLTSTLINPRSKLVRVRRYLVFYPLENGAVFPASELVYEKGAPIKQSSAEFTYLTRGMIGYSWISWWIRQMIPNKFKLLYLRSNFTFSSLLWAHSYGVFLW